MEDDMRKSQSGRNRSRKEKKPITHQSEHEDQVMTVREVAAYLKISASTVYHWTQDEKLPAMKLYGAVRFLKSDLDALILASRRGRVV